MKCYTKIFLHTILDIWRPKKSVNHFYLIFRYVNGCFKEINGNKCLTPFPTNESKEKI